MSSRTAATSFTGRQSAQSGYWLRGEERESNIGSGRHHSLPLLKTDQAVYDLRLCRSCI